MKLTVTENEMQSFADGLLMRLSGGSVILLSGELGAGKTTLVKALGIGLGIEKTITSPTFTLMNIYKLVLSIFLFLLLMVLFLFLHAIHSNL